MNTAERVKAFTALSHRTLEKLIVELIRDLQTRDDYTHLLGLFYSYFSGIENLIVLQNFGPEFPDFYERRKALLISHDISALQGQVQGIVQNKFLPEIRNSFQAFGALYVLEGSTLGGPHIVQMIQKKLGLKEDVFRFFSGYGDQNIAMWEKFKRVLNSLSESEDDINTVLTGAEDTFQKFGEWIKSNKHGKC